MTSVTANVLIIDDHQAARQGIAWMVEKAGFDVAASVESGKEAMELLSNVPCEVVLVDVRMRNMDGLATIEGIRDGYPELPIIVLSAYDNPTYVARASALGANDYVLKTASATQLGQCIRVVLAGQTPSLGSRLLEVQRVMRQTIDAGQLPPELPLTGREAQVLRHVALGLSNKEIARSLTISVETVKEHVQNILRKIKATDRTDAAVRAVKLGLAG